MYSPGTIHGTSSTMKFRCQQSHHWNFLLILFFILLTEQSDAFVPSSSNGAIERTIDAPGFRTFFPFCLAAKKKNKKKSGGGGFGGGGASSKKAATKTKDATIIKPVRADKDSLEAQWDSFAAITDLEIKPTGDPNDDDYKHFEVADVFVRSGGDADKSTGWFRIGKVCTSQEATLEAALTLQKGLVFWTAVHMRRELMALGKASATSLELGYITPAIVYMGSETDGPMDEEEAEDYLRIFDSKPPPEILQKVSDRRSIGFRPDWNPPGFTYKRRESAAMKDKSKKSASRLEDALDD